MKFVFMIIKKLCLGIFAIYSFNVLFSVINVVIPINLFTISMSSFLGIFGVISVLVMKYVI
ncbi:MAG: pro-sigmaK processing inhibitor BofA family protein [Candidatus Coprovivens sp.]